MKYIIKTPCTYKGKFYGGGSEIELTNDEAKEFQKDTIVPVNSPTNKKTKKVVVKKTK